jgi:hypothetical protein
MKKVDNSLLHEGGDDDADEAPPPAKKSKIDKKKDKYADALNDFSVKNSGCSDESPLNKDRKCQDPICLILFLIFLGAMLGCTIYGISNGDVKKMMAPYDYQNRFCGIGAMAEYDNLYFTDLEPSESEDVVRMLFNNAVCVKNCPKTDGASLESECEPGESKCAGKTTKKTMDLLDYCVPTTLTTEERSNFNEGFYKMLDANPFGQQMIAIYNCATALSLSMLTAFLLSLAYLFAISAFGECLAWAIIYFVGISLIAATGLGFFCWVSPATFGVTSMSPALILCISILLAIATLLFFIALYCTKD